MTLTAERARELLDYDPETGVFVYRAPRRGIKVGDIAGCPNKAGYLRIFVDGVSYYAHRLAWLHVHGEWPPGDLDHEDTIKDHNWIGNLRPASQSQNNANKPRPANNTSGFKGVSRQHGKWRARVGKSSQSIHLGLHATPELARAAYVAAAQRLFGQFARSE